MARIAGVDIPREKRVDVSLRYIFGIGATTAKEVLEQARIEGATRVRDLTERPPPRDRAEHQAPAGDRQLPRSSSPAQLAGSRAAHAHQCAHAPRNAQDGSRKKEGGV